MTQELIERTAREWVHKDSRRAAREVRRLSRQETAKPATSAEEMVEALVRLAGRLHVAETRCW